MTLAIPSYLLQPYQQLLRCPDFLRISFITQINNELYYAQLAQACHTRNPMQHPAKCASHFVPLKITVEKYMPAYAIHTLTCDKGAGINEHLLLRIDYPRTKIKPAWVLKRAGASRII